MMPETRCLCIQPARSIALAAQGRTSWKKTYPFLRNPEATGHLGRLPYLFLRLFPQKQVRPLAEIEARENEQRRTRFCEPLNGVPYPFLRVLTPQDLNQCEPVSARASRDWPYLFLRGLSQKRVRLICKPRRQAFG